MDRVLIDPSVLIDVATGVEPSSTAVRGMLSSGTEGCVCPVIVVEFFAGVHPDDLPRWERYFDRLRFLPVTREANMTASRYRYDFARRGGTLATSDSLIAAVAREYGAVLLTENPKRFPMDDIVVRSLRTY